MTSLPHLDDRHVELQPGEHFSILLGNSNNLRHIVDTAYWLKNLATNCGNVSAWNAINTMIQAIITFDKVWNFFLAFPFLLR